MLNLSNLVGQKNFSESVNVYLNMYIAGLAPENRPAGVFYLLGPTGVGKTHAVQCLARELHDYESNMIVINCGEYQMEHEIAKLIGAPPGYLGHRETQPVISQQKLMSVRARSCYPSIVLFDEIEKAAGSLERILLGVLDNGTLRLGDGTLVNFKDTFIFMSSNVGSRVITEANERRIGFGNETKGNAASTKANVRKELKKRFSSEFLNRVDEIVQFELLTQEEVVTIVEKQLDKLAHKVKDLSSNPILRPKASGEIELIFDDSAIHYLADKAYDPDYGAREVKRVIFREVQTEVANLLLAHKNDNVKSIKFSSESGELAIQVVKNSTPAVKPGAYWTVVPEETKPPVRDWTTPILEDPALKAKRKRTPRIQK